MCAHTYMYIRTTDIGFQLLLDGHATADGRIGKVQQLSLRTAGEQVGHFARVHGRPSAHGQEPVEGVGTDVLDDVFIAAYMS